MPSWRANSADQISQADVNAFCCSLIGRRFPKLRSLKEEHINELVLLRHQITGTTLPLEHKRHPKSKELHVDVLVYIGHSKGTHGVKGADVPRKQLGLRTVAMPLASDTSPVQRHNEAWKWAGEAFPGKKHWRPSGKACAREDASRKRLERFLTDENKRSEHSVAHDVEWQRALDSRRRWLAGDFRLPDASSAEESISRKATLMSADEECLRDQVKVTRQRSQQMTARLKSQCHATRGHMLHSSFPALPAGSAALSNTGHQNAWATESGWHD
eukprot:jgi/Ulvmu1/5616/UM023_0155.1